MSTFVAAIVSASNNTKKKKKKQQQQQRKAKNIREIHQGEVIMEQGSGGGGVTAAWRTSVLAKHFQVHVGAASYATSSSAVLQRLACISYEPPECNSG